MKNRAGACRSSLSGEARYKTFVPRPLPPSPPLILNESMVQMLVAANKSLAALECISSRLPGVKPLISLYLRKEALMSSQIEGLKVRLWRRSWILWQNTMQTGILPRLQA